MTRARITSIVRGIRYGLGAVVVIALGALVAGTAYQYAENRRDLREHPAPGQLVDVGGHRLHIWCTGVGSPVVVLEAGGGDSSLAWSHVQPEIAKTTRVCSYDRAGVGWSDLGPNPRSAAQIVSELHALLNTAKVSGPYVLVGHSIGGLYARLYASTYPTDVTGMVLVDSTHEDTQQYIAGAQGANPLVVYLHSFMTVVGYARLAGIQFAGGGLSPEARELAKGIRDRTTWPLADGSESLAQAESATQVRRTRRVLNIPLVVVTRGRYDGVRRLPKEDQDRNRKAWEDLQTDLVKLSPQGTQVVADASGHYVHLEQPDVVIGAIRRVVTEAQLGATTGSVAAARTQ